MKHRLAWMGCLLVLLVGCATPTPQTVRETVLVTQAALPTYTPYPTYTPQEPLPTYTLDPTYTPYPTYTPVRYLTATPWPTHTPRPTSTPTATPTAIPPAGSGRAPTVTPTPTPVLLSAPILLEPESGARFAGKVRFKWYWFRRLGENEKFSVRLASFVNSEQFEWWVTEEGLLDSGGAIQPIPAQTLVSAGKAVQVPDGYRFEINSGVGPIPVGPASWSITVVGETPARKWQISQRSEQRLIYKVP
jgi:hypothetical protein